MKVVKRYIFFLFLFQISQLASAQVDVLDEDSIRTQIPVNLDIYLVIGQSNMAGRATIREEDNASIENAYLFTGDDEAPWLAATNPLNRYSTVRKDMKMQRLSPAFSFARSMAAEHSGSEIGLSQEQFKSNKFLHIIDI